ncbi:2-dehydro-3-deoxygluconokinase [Acrocarpospora pleiomorpha]|uniref:2-dehydro-3-deoxygluconokinase n=1 Tax=Acrocarpospora pleiomorpha TaxID=90975 RepID=A0A5M3XNV5_9ACTN|nr:sugar kinase [Acrocarpospora pleiomorpha]GES20813.1 2-dehydro-3-deoxygluconokinase [Acrocarpospora pleiomorpha]
MRAEVLTIGEAMAAVRCAGPLRLGGASRISVAGAEFNVAIALARLGHAARWAGAVGEDEPGELVRRTLRAEGVLTDAVIRRTDAPTGLLLRDVAPGGRARVSYYRTGSAASALSWEDIRPAADHGFAGLHLTGITPALGPAPLAAVTVAADQARNRGSWVSLDVNHRSLLWTRDAAARALRPLLPQVTVLIASDDELAIVADGDGERDRVEALLDAGVEEVVIKRGAAGASYRDARTSLDAPALAVPVVDVVGAGDAFTAGYLSGRLDGLDAHGRLERATLLGAACVACDGDWEGLPTRDELPALRLRAGDTLR